MEIFLMRHGIAEDLQPGEMDANRELTTKGIAKTELVASRIEDRRPSFYLGFVELEDLQVPINGTWTHLTPFCRSG